MVQITDEDAGAILVLLGRVQLQGKEAGHFIRVVQNIEEQLTPQDDTNGNNLQRPD